MFTKLGFHSGEGSSKEMAHLVIVSEANIFGSARHSSFIVNHLIHIIIPYPRIVLMSDI